MKMEYKKFPYVLLFLIIILTSGLMIYCVQNGKNSISGDELFSYGSANQAIEGRDGWIVLSDRTWYDGDYFADYMSADEENRFSYSHVWKNQEADVHPPFYYAILHTVSSFFPDVFSIWFAAGINIVFMLLTMLVLYKAGLLLYENSVWALSLCFIYGISYGMINAVLFFRMYVMIQLWIIMAVYLHIKAVKGGSIAKAHGRDISYSLLIVTVAGILTHYYFLIFLAPLAGCYCLYRIYQRNWRELFRYFFTMLLSASVIMHIYPKMIHHLFGGYRGSEALSNLLLGEDLWNKLKAVYKGFNKELFGKCLTLFLVFFLVYALYCVILLIRGKEKPRITYKGICLVMFIITILFYSVVIAKIAPFITMRYYMPVYSLCILCVIGIFFTICKRLIKKLFIVS